MGTIPSAPRIAVRTTASRATGLGHLRRCLTLASELDAAGAEVSFWVDGDGSAFEILQAQGHTVEKMADEPDATLQRLGRDRPDALIVDSYALDEGYFAAVRPAVACMVAIDDLADRRFDVDFVINGNGDALTRDYRIGDRCRLLRGARFALLRSCFRDLPPHAERDTVERILVTLGGADPGGHTLPLVAELLRATTSALDVVIGPLFGSIRELEALANQTPRLSLHRAPSDLLPLIRAADLAVIGGGQTTLELAAAGLPALAVRLAENQRGNLGALAAAGSLVDLGPLAAALDSGGLVEAVARIAADPSSRRRMSVTGQRLVDGWGAVRVARALLGAIRTACEWNASLRLVEGSLSLRPLGPEDTDDVLGWRSQPDVLAQLFSDRPPTREEHEQFLRGVADGRRRRELVILDGAAAVGTIGLSAIDLDSGVAEYGVLVGEPSARGRGIASRASRLLLSYAFDVLLLDCVRLELFADNDPARRLYEGLGFLEDAPAPGPRPKQGQMRAVKSMSLTRRMWRCHLQKPVV